MGNDNRAMFERTTKFYAEWGNGMAAQANRLGVFLHAHVERSGTELWPQKVDSRDSLAALSGADGSARGCRSAGAARLRDSMGTRRDRRIATLPHFDFTISGAIDQSKYVLRDEEHVEARDRTGSSV